MAWSLSPGPPRMGWFRQGLRASGFCKGQNLIIEFRYPAKGLQPATRTRCRVYRAESRRHHNVRRTRAASGSANDPNNSSLRNQRRHDWRGPYSQSPASRREHYRAQYPVTHQSVRAASTGRTHDCKRPQCCTPNNLLPCRGLPHMRGRVHLAGWRIKSKCDRTYTEGGRPCRLDGIVRLGHRCQQIPKQPLARSRTSSDDRQPGNRSFTTHP